MNEQWLERRKAHGQLILDAIREHTLANGWPPSQRTLVEMTGLNLQRVNSILKMLVEQGLIELGPNPREVRIVGSVMTIPQVTL